MADLTHVAKVLAVDLPLAGCPTPCDPDCSASCHESHVPPANRAHDPGFQCGEVQILIAAARMQERERIRRFAIEKDATYTQIATCHCDRGAHPYRVGSPRPFAELLEGTDG